MAFMSTRSVPLVTGVRARGSLARRLPAHGLQRLDAAALARGSLRPRAVLPAGEPIPTTDLARRPLGRRSAPRRLRAALPRSPLRVARAGHHGRADDHGRLGGVLVRRRGRSFRCQHLPDPAGAAVSRLGSPREVDGRVRPLAHAAPPRAGRTDRDRGVLLPLPAASAARVGDVREQPLRAQPRLPADQPARDEGEHGGPRRSGRPRAAAARLPPPSSLLDVPRRDRRRARLLRLPPRARRDSSCGRSSSACSRSFTGAGSRSGESPPSARPHSQAS